MQWIAMITMLIDHIGAIFFPSEALWRMIGRLSFPIYLYLLVTGYYRTRSYPKYVLRLTLLAIVSQLPYQYAFDTTRINVIATLLVCLLILKLLDLPKSFLALKVAGVIATIVLLEWLPFDYGAYGLILCLIYRYLNGQQLMIAHFITELVAMIRYEWRIQFVSLIVSYVLNYYPNHVQQLNKFRAPRIIWRSFYPLHLIILALISTFINMLGNY